MVMPPPPRGEVITRIHYTVAGLLRSEWVPPVIIFRYTSRTVRERLWDEITLNSRGIVFNEETGECLARPFPKFFDVGECVAWEELTPESVEGVYEKVDGWMGTLYRHGGQFHIATGGSLVTEGGRIATDMLRQHDLTDLPDDVTLVFEIVHPHTRVVVDYGECRELVLLAAFNRYTGDEYPWTSVEAWGRRFGFRTPTRWPWNEAMVLGALEQYAPDRWEGFVVKLLDGRRAKLRSAAYVAALRASEPARRGRIL